MTHGAQDLVIGETATSKLSLLWHGVAVVSEGFASTTLAIGIAVCREVCCGIGLAAHINEIEHVFNTGEGFEDFAGVHDLASSTGAVGSVATRTAAVGS